MIFLILGLYLDNVLPGVGGVRKPWYYCLTGKYWCPSEIHDGANISEIDSPIDDRTEKLLTTGGSESLFEEVGHDLRTQKSIGEAFSIESMTKKFADGKVAVKNFTLDIYKGQVFILLGHNGAGKTTALSMLTGLLQPTSGKAIIKGIDVFRENSKLKEMLGICPQESIVYDQLTIEEHLNIFCALKGLEYASQSEELMKIMVGLGFADCLRQKAKTLSGGQKRKLSVLLALIGDPAVLMLDEPTSGLDVDARSKIWTVIKGIKHDRIVMMTTHYMDEAEELGDRIAIMSDGEIKCCGSSLFLKRQFKTGYHLTMEKTAAFNKEGADRLIAKFTSDFSAYQESISEIIYRIPFEASNTFSDMFAELDNSLQTIGVSSYGIAVTSLEDVFLKVGADHSKDQKTEDDNEFSISRSAKKSFARNTFAVILRIWLQTIRNPRILVLELLLPLLLFGIAIGVTVFNSSRGYVYNINAVTKKFPIVMNTLLPNSDAIQRLRKHIPFELWNLDFKREESNPLSRAEAFYELENESYGANKHFGAFYVDGLTESGDKVLKAMVIGDPNLPQMPTYLCSILTNAFLKMHNEEISFTASVSPMPVYDQLEEAIYPVITMIGFVALTGIAFSVPIASIAYFLVKEKKSEQKFLTVFHGLGLAEYWIGRFCGDFTKLLLPFAIIIGIKYFADIQVSALYKS